jgi:MFS transporter, PPP family, 3-phenylpropionic acid transporter
MALSTATRISLFYLTLHACMGVYLPGMQAWYQAQGVTPAQLGALGFITILARVITNPFVGSWIDRNGHARRVTIALSVLTVGLHALNLWGEGFLVLLAIAVAYTIVRAPVGPLGDAIALTTCQREGIDFGRVRFWGSVGFMVFVIIGGPLIDHFGVQAVPLLALPLFVLTVLGAWALPRDAEVPRGSRPQAPVRFLLRQPVFIVFLAASSLAQASHAVLYAFSTLHWNAVGLNQTQVGWLWGVSTTIELVVFWWSRPIVTRFRPATMMALGALTTLPRWGFHAVATDFWVFMALQLLHAGTFAITYLGALQFIARQLPPSHAASAQTLNAGANALLMGLAMLALGPVYAAHGGLAYLAMAAMGIVAAGAALWLRHLSRGDKPAPPA